MTGGSTATVDLAERARALLPRSWKGEDVRGEIRSILEQAQRSNDAEGECAARYAEVADSSTRGDEDTARRSTIELIERAESAGLPLWESRGRHYLAWIHLAAGEEAQGIEELVTAEVLTSQSDEPSASLAGAINGVAATYLLLDLYEEGDRLFDRMVTIQQVIDDPWLHQVLVYNRLLNDATWAVNLERVGETDQARERLQIAYRRASEASAAMVEPTLDADVALLILFAEVMTGHVDVETARERLTDLTATGYPMESESFLHFALAVREAAAGNYREARAEISVGREKQDRIRNEQIRHALHWLGGRVAILEAPDHEGLQEAWSYAELTTQTIWEVRLRRRDAVRDRLKMRRLRSEKEHVERVSLEDPLTGVANRRRLDRERSDLEVATNAGWTAVAYLDIDHFKEVNDTLGHDLGDEVLRHLSTAIRASVRNHDIIGRYGGDEFVLVSRDCDPDTASGLGERVAAAVRAHPWSSLHPSLAIRVSVGIAVTDRAYDQLFAAADDALYTAKQAGRDQVVVRTIGAAEAASA